MEVLKYGKLLHEKGLAIGSGGNISQRLGDTLIIKRKGYDMSTCHEEGYMTLPLREFDKYKDEISSEAPSHIACYTARDNITAVIHAHSPFMVAASQRASLIDKISYESDCIISSPVPVIGFIQPGSSELGDAIAEHINLGANAVLMKNHGGISIGTSMEEAYLRILALERMCIAYVLGWG